VDSLWQGSAPDKSANKDPNIREEAMANQNDVITVTGISASVDVQDVPVPGATDIIGGYQPINLFNKVVITDSDPNALLGAIVYAGGNGGFGSLNGFAMSQFSPDAGTYWHTTQPFTAAQLTAIFDNASFYPGGHQNRGTNSAFANITIFEGTPQPGTLVASYVAPPNVPSTFASIGFTEIPPPSTIDAGGIKVSYSPPEGGIVDGSTTHPLRVRPGSFVGFTELSDHQANRCPT
jgi:hypothetical protein